MNIPNDFWTDVGDVLAGYSHLPMDWAQRWQPVLQEGGHALLAWYDRSGRKSDDWTQMAVGEFQHWDAVSRFHTIVTKLGVVPLYYKGFALGHDVYPAAYLRQRSDIDVIIPEAMVADVRRALVKHGFREPLYSGANELFRQVPLLWCPEDSPHTAFDVHWDVTARKAWSHYLTYDELLATARPIRGLPGLLTPAKSHQWLITCLHPHLHHQGERRQVWLADLLFLSRTMIGDDWRQLQVLTERLQVGNIVAPALDLLRPWLPVIPPCRLSTQGSARSRQLLHRLSPTQVAWENWTSLANWDSRLEHLRLIFFPDREYIFQKYHLPRDMPLKQLWWWYAKRIFCRLRRMPHGKSPSCTTTSST